MTHLPTPLLRKRALMTAAPLSPLSAEPTVRADFKGDYVSTVEALGGQVVPLGHGSAGELDPLASLPVAGGSVAKPEGDR